MSAIFLSHSSKDAESAARVHAFLVGSRHASLFLDYDPVDGIPAGRRWEEDLYARLRQCRAIVVLCSAHSMSSPWCFAEITHARAEGKHVFALKLDGCTVVGLLSDVQIIDVCAVGWDEALDRLHRGLVAVGLDPRKTFAWKPERPPYPGLPPFERDDAAVYFGRDEEIETGLGLLHRARRLGGPGLVLVVGPSGSGKSSLVRAGILPRVASDRDAWIPLDPVRPGDAPFSELAKALAASFPEGKGPEWRTIRDVLLRVAEGGSARELRDLVDDLRMASRARDATVLVAFDQLEEVLRAGAGAEELAFLSGLGRLLDACGTGLRAIATLRSDFLGAFQASPAALDVSRDLLSLGPMSMSGLRRVITGPADVSGLRLDDGLADEILGEARSAGALPLLAVALFELWKRRDADGRLRRDHYRQMGGLAGSIRRAAEAVLEEHVRQTGRGSVDARGVALSSEDEGSLRDAFVALARIDGERYTRATVQWSDVPIAVQPIMDRLVGARLLTRGEKEPVVEVTAEAVFDAWDRVRAWLDDERDFLRWRRRLEAAVDEWTASGAPAGDGLLRDAALATAASHAARHPRRLSADERRYIQLGVEAEERRRFRDRRRLYVAHVGLAHRLWSEGNIELMQDLLMEHLPAPGDRDQRGFEWRYLWRLCHPELVELFVGSPLTALAIGPADSAAIGTEDGKVVVWNAASGAVMRRHAPGARVFALAFDARARVVAALSDGRVLRWAGDGAADTLVALEGFWESAALTPDGRHVAFVATGALCVRDLASGAERTPPPLDPSWTTPRVALSGDGRQLVLPTGLGGVQLWTGHEGDGWRAIGMHRGAVRSVAFGGNDRVASGAAGLAIAISNLETSKATTLSSGDATDLVNALAFSGDGTLLAVGTADPENASKAGLVAVIDVATGRSRAFKGHTASVDALAFERDGQRLLSASRDGTAKVWDITTDPEWTTMQAEGGRIFALAFSPRGDLLATGREGSSSSWSPGTVQLWDVARRAVTRTFRGHSSPVSAVAFAPAGDVLLSGGSDGMAAVWELSRPDPVAPLTKQLGAPIHCAAFSPNERWFAVGGGTPVGPGFVRVWRASDGEEFGLEPHRFAALAIAFSADEGALAAAGGDYGTMTEGELEVWDLVARAPIDALGGSQGWTRSVAFSPDGALLAVGSGSRDRPGSVRVWDVTQRTLRAELRGHQHAVQTIAFSPDGMTLASGAGPGHTQHTGEVKLWDTLTLEELLTLRGYQRWVYRAAFAPDGLALATVSGDDTVRLWTAASDDAVSAHLERRLESAPDDAALLTALASLCWARLARERARGGSSQARRRLAQRGLDLVARLLSNPGAPAHAAAWRTTFERDLS